MIRFGLIGKGLSHSFSPRYFQEKFLRENLPGCSYEVFELASAGELRKLISNNPPICGLNVTVPFKSAVMSFLDACDPVARQVGAVNTIGIRRKKGKIYLTGYNTDVWGFENSTDAFRRFDHALVLGTGGAAKAVGWVLEKWAVNFLMVSRSPGHAKTIGYEDLTPDLLKKFRFIINTTPVGMFPRIGESPNLPYHLLGANHFLYDLIYNPAETRFLFQGRENGAAVLNGMRMLELQAERSWELWHL